MDDASEFAQGIAGSYGAAEAAMGQDFYQSQVAATNGHAAMLEAQTDAVYSNMDMMEKFNAAVVKQREVVTTSIQIIVLIGTLTWIIFMVHIVGGWIK